MNKKKIIIIICILIGLGLGCAGLYIYKEETKPVFTLNAETVNVEAGDDFDPYVFIEQVSYATVSDIVIDNPVKTEILGDYEVSYILGENEQKLLVKVEDTLAPTLKIKTGELFYYTDETVTIDSVVESVSDITDVTLEIDVLNQDISEAGDYTIEVVAVDGGMNETRRLARVHIRERDVTPPSITGIKDLTITAGDSVDLINGIIVEDDIDENPEIIIDASGFDKDKAGEYIILYTATDETGNSVTEERKITVNPKIVVPVIPEGAAPIVTDNVVNFIPPGGTFGWDASGKKDQPYLVAVNRAMNTVTVYGKDEAGNYTVPVKAMVCSVGREGHETITGRYKTTERYEWCYMVDGTWGRYAIRIKGGYMFHSIGYFKHTLDSLEYDEFNKLGNPASLGCIRLCLADIYWLYAYCPTGFETVIYDDYALAGPLGKPTSIYLDTTNELTRNWDPTDPEYPY